MRSKILRTDSEGRVYFVRYKVGFALPFFSHLVRTRKMETSEEIKKKIEALETEREEQMKIRNKHESAARKIKTMIDDLRDQLWKATDRELAEAKAKLGKKKAKAEPDSNDTF